MEQFVYKGIYTSDEIYDIHDSVKYGSNYYYALIPGPVSIPTNENEWENIGTDLIETTAIRQVYSLRNYTSYDVLEESIVDYNQIIDSLKNEGVTPIDALNKEFDPNIHQALIVEEVDGVAGWNGALG